MHAQLEARVSECASACAQGDVGVLERAWTWQDPVCWTIMAALSDDRRCFDAVAERVDRDALTVARVALGSVDGRAVERVDAALRRVDAPVDSVNDRALLLTAPRRSSRAAP